VNNTNDKTRKAMLAYRVTQEMPEYLAAAKAAQAAIKPSDEAMQDFINAILEDPSFN